MAAIDLKLCTLKISDGSSTPNVITIKVGEGNLTYTVARAREYILDRGVLDKVRNADETPLKVDFDIVYEFYESDSYGGEDVTPAEALQQTGAASGWVSTGSDPCEPYCVDIILEYEPDCSPTKDETLTFSEFRFESMDFDVRAGTISVSGSCNEVAPTSVRS